MKAFDDPGIDRVVVIVRKLHPKRGFREGHRLTKEKWADGEPFFDAHRPRLLDLLSFPLERKFLWSHRGLMCLGSTTIQYYSLGRFQPKSGSCSKAPAASLMHRRQTIASGCVGLR